MTKQVLEQFIDGKFEPLAEAEEIRAAGEVEAFKLYLPPGDFLAFVANDTLVIVSPKAGAIRLRGLTLPEG